MRTTSRAAPEDARRAGARPAGALLAGMALPAAVLAAMLGLPAGAWAAEPWGAARLLAEDGLAAGVALDDRGLAVAAFTERRGPRGRVRAARAPAGRAFGRPFALAPTGGLGLAPQVAFAGRTAAISYPRSRGRAELRLIGADGRRSAAAVLGNGEAVGDALGPLAVFAAVDVVGPLAFIQTVPVTEGGTGPPAQVPLSGAGGRFDVAVDAAGGTLATWTQGAVGGRQQVMVARRAPGARTFGPPQALSDPSRYARDPAVDVTAFGRAVVAWSDADGTGERLVVAERRTATERFGAPRVLAEELVVDPDVAATAGGGLFVAWQAPPRGVTYGSQPGPLRLAAIGGEERPRTVSGRARAGGFALAAGGRGGATVAWRRLVPGRGGGHTEVRAITATGRLGRAQRLSPRGESTLGAPSLAVGPRGDAIAAWPGTRGVRVARRPR
jgi:hypothetical protein